MRSIATSAARAQCSRRTTASHTGTLGGAITLFLDLGLHDIERLGVEVDLDLLAVLVGAVDLVAVPVDLELGDLVALRLQPGLGVCLAHPFRLGVGLARRAGLGTERQDGDAGQGQQKYRLHTDGLLALQLRRKRTLAANANDFHPLCQCSKMSTSGQPARSSRARVGRNWKARRASSLRPSRASSASSLALSACRCR